MPHAHAACLHHRGRPRACLRLRRARTPRCKAVAAGRLSARRRRDRPVHAGLRRRPEHRQRARRNRRHPADVRRRPAFLAARPAVGPRHRGAGRDRADRRRDRCSAWGSPGCSAGRSAAGSSSALALSVASTVVVLRALQERRLLDTERGHIAVGWLVVEDLAMVLVLVFLPALAGRRQGRRASIAPAVARAARPSRSASSRPSSR